MFFQVTIESKHLSCSKPIFCFFSAFDWKFCLISSWVAFTVFLKILWSWSSTELLLNFRCVAFCVLLLFSLAQHKKLSWMASIYWSYVNITPFFQSVLLLRYFLICTDNMSGSFTNEYFFIDFLQRCVWVHTLGWPLKKGQASKKGKKKMFKLLQTW